MSVAGEAHPVGENPQNPDSSNREPGSRGPSVLLNGEAFLVYPIDNPVV
jgi:hypothetical protein